MKTNSELKNRAIDALTGNWGLGAVITLVYGLVMNTPTLPIVLWIGGFVLLVSLLCCSYPWDSAILSFFGCDSWN
mgnify:CR=1 FL=1